MASKSSSSTTGVGLLEPEKLFLTSASFRKARQTKPAGCLQELPTQVLVLSFFSYTNERHR